MQGEALSNPAAIAIAPRPRRWWIAGPLNLIGFGVGYLYVGRPWRALAAAATTVLQVVFLWHGLNGWLAEPWIAFAVGGALLLLLLAFLVDAMLIARRSGDFALRWYNRWWLYAAIVLVGQTCLAFVDLHRSVRPFTMPAGSMEPTLRVGDHFMVNMRAFDDRQPERGDVAIFRLPRSPETIFVKRVIGLPGDEVQLKGGALYINGEAVPTSDAGNYTYSTTAPGKPAETARIKQEVLANGRKILVLDSTTHSHYDNTALFKVPPGNYFVLGDNRDNSTDSREQSSRYGVGYIPRANMLGVVSWIYWSPDRSRIGSRVK
jgi:signal peptidase I